MPNLPRGPNLRVLLLFPHYAVHRKWCLRASCLRQMRLLLWRSYCVVGQIFTTSRQVRGAAYQVLQEKVMLELPALCRLTAGELATLSVVVRIVYPPLYDLVITPIRL
jgi:hypothetical protein